MVDDKKDAEDNRPNTSNSENRYLRKNTHQTTKLIKLEIRIIASSPQKCMNKTAINSFWSCNRDLRQYNYNKQKQTGKCRLSRDERRNGISRLSHGDRTYQEHPEAKFQQFKHHKYSWTDQTQNISSSSFPNRQTP